MPDADPSPKNKKGLILFAILLTGLYVWRANRVYDRRMAEILAAHQA